MSQRKPASTKKSAAKHRPQPAKQSKRFGFPVLLFGFSSFLFVITLGLFIVLLHKNNLLPNTTHAAGGYISWPLFNGGSGDQGYNSTESYLTTSNVSGLQSMWSAATPSAADDSMVYQANVNVSGTLENLVFVNTIEGNLIAYNALTGSKVWEADPSTTDFNGQGTKSTPAVDPSGNYIYAYADDGYIHKYDISTGAEITGNGFPAQVTLLPNNVEKGSSSLNIGNGYLYMETSGNDGDYNHYVGHVIAVKLSNGAETVWNAECSNITQLLTNDSSDANYCANTESGMWARPGVQIDPVTGNVYVVTGNGLYDASSGGHDWGDSIIELSPNLSTIVDSYTPTDYTSLQDNDQDLGSTAPAMLPTQNNSNTPYMMVQGGKDAIIRLLNRANLSGQGGPGHTGGELQEISINSEVHDQPAVWTDGSGNTWVFVTDESGTLYAYKLVTTSGTSQLVQQYSQYIGVSSSPFVANGVLYFDGDNIMAYNATNGAQLFDSSSISISLSQHWEAPIVVNGALYTPDNNGNVYALYLPGVTPTTPPSSGTPPTVSYTSLTTGAQIHGNAQAVDSTATANNGGTISSCSLVINSSPVQTLTSAPFNFSLNTLGYADGDLGVSVNCTDNDGDQTDQPLTILVDNGDLTGAGHVNISDLAILAAHWGQSDSSYADGNITGQSTINLSDLAVLAANWGWVE